jgi:hypothetical protein
LLHHIGASLAHDGFLRVAFLHRSSKCSTQIQ